MTHTPEPTISLFATLEEYWRQKYLYSEARNAELGAQVAELLVGLRIIDDGDVDTVDDAIMVAREAIAKAGDV